MVVAEGMVALVEVRRLRMEGARVAEVVEEKVAARWMRASLVAGLVAAAARMRRSWGDWWLVGSTRQKGEGGMRGVPLAWQAAKARRNGPVARRLGWIPWRAARRSSSLRS